MKNILIMPTIVKKYDLSDAYEKEEAMAILRVALSMPDTPKKKKMSIGMEKMYEVIMKNSPKTKQKIMPEIRNALSGTGFNDFDLLWTEMVSECKNGGNNAQLLSGEETYDRAEDCLYTISRLIVWGLINLEDNYERTQFRVWCWMLMNQSNTAFKVNFTLIDEKGRYDRIPKLREAMMKTKYTCLFKWGINDYDYYEYKFGVEMNKDTKAYMFVPELNYICDRAINEKELIWKMDMTDMKRELNHECFSAVNDTIEAMIYVGTHMMGVIEHSSSIKAMMKSCYSGGFGIQTLNGIRTKNFSKIWMLIEDAIIIAKKLLPEKKRRIMEEDYAMSVMSENYIMLDRFCCAWSLHSIIDDLIKNTNINVWLPNKEEADCGIVRRSLILSDKVLDVLEEGDVDDFVSKDYIRAFGVKFMDNKIFRARFPEMVYNNQPTNYCDEGSEYTIPYIERISGCYGSAGDGMKVRCGNYYYPPIPYHFDDDIMRYIQEIITNYVIGVNPRAQKSGCFAISVMTKAMCDKFGIECRMKLSFCYFNPSAMGEEEGDTGKDNAAIYSVNNLESVRSREINGGFHFYNEIKIGDKWEICDFRFIKESMRQSGKATELDLTGNHYETKSVEWTNFCMIGRRMADDHYDIPFTYSQLKDNEENYWEIADVYNKGGYVKCWEYYKSHKERAYFGKYLERHIGADYTPTETDKTDINYIKHMEEHPYDKICKQYRYEERMEKKERIKRESEAMRGRAEEISNTEVFMPRCEKPKKKKKGKQKKKKR